MQHPILRKRNLLLFALLLLLAAAVYGFAASNTVPSTLAGDGEEVISGFEITNVHYELDATDPGMLAASDSVTFNISPSVPDGGSVRVALTHNGAEVWLPCSVSGGTAVSCDAGSNAISILGITNLRVVAAQ